LIKTALFIYGLCFVLIDSTIFSPIREQLVKVMFFEKLLNCYFCVGCWVALAVWLVKNRPLPPITLTSFFSMSEFVFCQASLALGIHFVFSLLEGLAAYLAYRLGD
jgi:hypothetical protein